MKSSQVKGNPEMGRCAEGDGRAPPDSVADYGDQEREVPDLTAKPWCQWSERVTKLLLGAGYDTTPKLVRAQTVELLKILGFGQAALRDVRAVIPAPGPKLVPQANGGMLKSGGTPGNKGGGPPPPSEVRKAARLEFSKRIPRLAEIADGTGILRMVERCEQCGAERGRDLTVDELRAALVPVREQIRAIDLLGKYGQGSAKGVPRDELLTLFTLLAQEAQEVLRTFLPDEDDQEQAWDSLRTRWRRVTHDQLTG